MSNGSEGQAAAADCAAGLEMAGASPRRQLTLGAGEISDAQFRRRIAAITRHRCRLRAAPTWPVVFEVLERRGLLSDATFDSTASVADAIALPASGVDSVAPSGRPSVTSTNPGDGATDVLRDTFISANLLVPDGGIDTNTLTAASVNLYRVSDGAPVAAAVNTSGGGDVLVLSPSAPLDPDTEYAFEVTEDLRDVSGGSFDAFSMHFWTGTDISAPDPSLRFDRSSLQAPAAPYTAVTIGPDHRLYAAVETGEIFRFEILSDGTLGNSQVISSLVDANGGTARLLTGIEFDPASNANDLVLWTTHSYFALDSAPDWTGKVTRLSGPDLATVQDYVVGLPRSTRDHVSNQLRFGPDGAIYFPQASNTAMGAPDYAWHFRPERYLSASILRLDVGMMHDRMAAGQGPIDVQTEEGGVYNPHVPGAPLTLFATGVRNAYDLLWHSNGNLYAPGNGSQRGGATPAGEGVPAIDFVDEVESDYLFSIQPNGYYGHPNPSRHQFVRNGGNPTNDLDPLELTQYPVGTLPDSNYRLPIYEFGRHYSPNGLIEYRGGAFGGTLEGKILIARYSGGDDIAVLTVNADGQIVEAKGGVEGLKNFNDPLDLTEDLTTGFLYIAEFGGQSITLVKPAVEGSPPGVAAPRDRVPPGPYGLSISTVGKSALELNWTDTVGETAYEIQRRIDGSAEWNAAGTTGANETRFVDSGLVRDQTYAYRIRAVNEFGASEWLPAAAATTPPRVLPEGWTGEDIGSVPSGGSGDYGDGVFELIGSGTTIGGNADAFFFAGVPVTGDVEIVAHVVGVDASNANAGVMIRASNDPAAANATMGLSASNGPQFQIRPASDASTAYVSGNVDNGERWIRLVRRGDLVSGYTSPDGVNWKRIAFERIELSQQMRIGLAVAAKDASAATTATFDNVRINAAPTLPVPEAPTDLFATAAVGARIDLTWRDNSLDETAFDIERRRAVLGSDWMRIATVGAETFSYIDDHLSPSKKYEYRVVAVNAAGASTASNEAQSKTGKLRVKGQTPFTGSPSALPGIIEAEAFDEGPRGKAWRDRTADNDFAVFRDSGADIAQTSDPAGGAFHIVASKGEWLEYTIDAPQAGTYTVELRLAAAEGFGGTAHFESDGVKVTVGGSIGLPATGGWDTWQTAAGAINLKAGVQVLRLCIDAAANASGDVACINWLRLAPASSEVASFSGIASKAALKPGRAAERIYAALFSTEPAITGR